MPDVPAQSIRELLGTAEEAFADAAFCTGDFSEARVLIEHALDRATAAEDVWNQATATERLGLLHHYENITKRMIGLEILAADVDAEEALFRDALARRRALSDEPGAALPLFGLGLVAQVLRRDWTVAIDHFRESLALIEVWGDAVDLYTRSEVHRHVGFYYAVEDVHPDKAVLHLQRSLELREMLGDRRRLTSGLESLGEAELAAGNTRRGIELLERAVMEAHAAGLHPKRIETAQRILDDALRAGPP